MGNVWRGEDSREKIPNRVGKREKQRQGDECPDSDGRVNKVYRTGVYC